MARGAATGRTGWVVGERATSWRRGEDGRGGTSSGKDQLVPLKTGAVETGGERATSWPRPPTGGLGGGRSTVGRPQGRAGQQAGDQLVRTKGDGGQGQEGKQGTAGRASTGGPMGRRPVGPSLAAGGLGARRRGGEPVGRGDDGQDGEGRWRRTDAGTTSWPAAGTAGVGGPPTSGRATSWSGRGGRAGEGKQSPLQRPARPATGWRKAGGRQGGTDGDGQEGRWDGVDHPTPDGRWNKITVQVWYDLW